MGTDIKALRIRIKSVNSTRHLTEAMGLAASSKIRKANIDSQKSQDYEKNLELITSTLTASRECAKEPYMRAGGSRTRLIVIAGDRGMAGGYNSNIFKLTAQFPEAEIIPVGYRACDKFGGKRVSSEHFGIGDAVSLSARLCGDFIENKYDKLGIVGTKYISVMSREPFVKWIFPLSRSEKRKNASLVFEPDEATVLKAVIPEYVTGAITASVKESFAGEVAARKIAMDSASRNAKQMVEDLQLCYNRMRQSSITREITEITAGITP